MPSGGSADELLKQLQVQAELNRAAAIEASSDEVLAAYRNADGTAADGTTYRVLGDASTPEGTNLAANYDPESGEVVWVETYETGEPQELAQRVPCANDANCLDDNFCFGWYECDPCDWCENNQCQPRDPARPCNADWECPCAPNERQHYDCVTDTCRLTCEVNEDCGPEEVCGLLDGYCGPGCTTDAQCDPTNPDRVGDAQENTFCMDFECVFACDPVRFCETDGDCTDGEYCGERVHRVASDPAGQLYQCLKGCANDAACPDGKSCDTSDRQCKTFCEADEDCPEDEACQNDGVCSTVGAVCIDDGDCQTGSWCNFGRCEAGCNTDDHCLRECGKLPSCLDACPPDPTCTCTGDGCYNENWRDLCPRDPACVEACPEDGECLRFNGKTCLNNRCERTCSDSSECLEDELCNGGLCMVRATEGEAVADDRLGCECGDVCNQYGTCEVAICKADSECPPCSICEEGVCIPGCGDDNPCPDGGCCNPDGRCSRACTADYQCADLEGNQLCLETGCCGLICDPLVPCISSSDCQPGEYCAEENYCLPGCLNDSDCASLAEEQGGLYQCSKAYVRAPNGALAPCEFYPGEECFSEVGQCETYCTSDSQCLEGEICTDGRCGPPPEPPCQNDDDCEGFSICLGGNCTVGCRFDKDCFAGEACVANRCEQTCSDNQVCAALFGEKAICLDGICQRVNGGPGAGPSRKGCECFEFCDELGYCTPYQCDSDLDCEEEACGSCLVGNVCGVCFTDEDCPGVKICDQALDQDGNPRKDPDTGEVLGGECAYPCTPDSPGTCIGDDDCTDGFFCAGDRCERGCNNNEDCLPDEVCRGSQCRKACTGSSCPTGYTCIQGACLYTGKPCDTNNNQALQKQDEIAYLDARIAASDDPNQVEQWQAEKEIKQIELEQAQSSQCGPNEICDGTQCVPPPIECLETFECEFPAECIDGVCTAPPDAESFRSFEPQVIGCESCAETCIDGKCGPAPCERNDDCQCGTCSAAGLCVETCRTDLDCGALGVGRCVGGECVECLSNRDCQNLGNGAVCDGGECKSPCFEDLTTGSCLDGLNDGDTCEACPDQCPDGAPCRKTSEVCNVVERYNPLTGLTTAELDYCKKCSRTCITSADCEDGTICGPFGICEISDGRCVSDSDCYEDALAKGLGGMRCRNNTCIELGDNCFTASDCDPGEVCDDGQCKGGTCGDQDPCQVGKVCVENQCVWQCGSGADKISCGGKTAVSCPPGMTCSGDLGYGGFCLRRGMTLNTLEDPGCPSGTFCSNGGCVDKTTQRNCSTDDNCSSGVCCEGVCRSSCNDRLDQAENPADESRGLEKKNNCELRGLCCGDDGFCTACECSEDNPCPGGECCDQDSGTCVVRGSHPQTRYGAPYDCTFDDVYCYVNDPQGGQIDVDQLGGPEYRGCEVIDADRQIVKCWEGGPKNSAQITRLLENVCWEPKKKQCKCDEIPSDDECQTDADCGGCAKCKERTFVNDACCGVYGEGEYELPQGFTGPEGFDRVSRNVCEGDAEGECGCRSDADCTECEFCFGGSADQLGSCRQDCENRCPCGGPLSRTSQECPTCEERFGPCATDATLELNQSVDPVTGEIVEGTTIGAQCACVLDQTKECCKGLNSFDDMRKHRVKCLELTTTLADGQTNILQADKCIDEEEDLCAECLVDAHCPGRAKCQGYKCVRECGTRSSDPNLDTYDRHDVGGIGGDPFSCWCCTDQGDCRALNDSFIESEGAQTGPWTINYVRKGGQVIGEGADNETRTIGITEQYYSAQDDYNAALAELRQFRGDVEVLSSQGSEGSGKCRPCQCTSTGLDCGSWADCESCYAWVRADEADPGSPEKIAQEQADKAESIRLEDAIRASSDAATEAEEKMQTAFEEYQEARGLVQSALQSLATVDAATADQLGLIQEQIDALQRTYDNEQSTLWSYQRDTQLKREQLALALEDPGATVEEAEFAATEVEAYEAREQQQLDVVTDLSDQLYEKELEAAALTQQLGSDAQVFRAEYEQAVQQQKSAWEALQAAIEAHDNANQANVDALGDYNNHTYPPDVEYVQKQTCDCCIEQTCREDIECELGTCWICADEDPGKYFAAVYGKISELQIKPGQEIDIAKWGDYEVTGHYESKFRVGVDQCVVAPCGPLVREDRLCTGTSQRFHEYCAGSIIACVLSYRPEPNDPRKSTYKNGYDYKIDCSEAGLFFSDDFSYTSEEDRRWVQLGFYDPQPGAPINQATGSPWPMESSCAVANYYGFIRGRTMPTFDDLVATHPICQKGVIIHGCPEDYPDCSVKLRSYFSQGNSIPYLAKLKGKIEQLEGAYEFIDTQVRAVFQDVIESSQSDLAVLNGQQDEADSQRQQAVSELEDATNTEEQLVNNLIPAKQQQIANKQEEIDGNDDSDGLQADFEEAQQDLNEVRAELEAAQGVLAAMEFELETTKVNLDGARVLANQLYLERNDLNQQILQAEQDLAGMVPGSAEYVQQEILITNLTTQRDQVAQDYSAATADVLQFDEIVRTLSCDRDDELEPPGSTAFGGRQAGDEEVAPRTTCEAQDDIEKIEEDVALAESAFVSAAVAVGDARFELNQLIAELTSLNQQLLQARANIETYTELKEFWENLSGVDEFDPNVCCEGYNKKDILSANASGEIVTTGQKCCNDSNVCRSVGCDVKTCGEICQKIDIVEIRIEQFETAIDELDVTLDQIQSQIDELQQEFDDYKDSGGYVAEAEIRKKGEALNNGDQLWGTDELKKAFEDNVELNEYLQEQEPWMPGNEPDV